jgi:L-ascorbate metabolism protein UlaG (beta-lactamase superfamily)
MCVSTIAGNDWTAAGARPGDHFDGRRFFNPAGAAPQSFSAVPRMLLERRTPWPERIDTPSQPLPALGPDETPKITFIGHSTFLIQTAAGNILTDPMYSQRAGPLNVAGPKRIRQPAIALDDLPPIAIVLLSHNHYDHCDLRTLGTLKKRFDPLVVTPLGNAALVRSAGMTRIEELDWWQPATRSPLPVTLTPARHFSARTPFDRNRALWGGFVVAVDGRQIYFAGDSGYGAFFSAIGARCGPIDVALLPIGAYEPRWFMQPVHMNPAEAVQAHIDLGAVESIGMHFGTFRLTSEGVDDPVHALEQARLVHGISPAVFRVLEFGETVSVRTARRD